MELVYDTKIYSTFCKLLAGAMKFMLYDELSELLAKPVYITNALCVMNWLCRDRSALCVTGPKIKRTQKVCVTQTFCVLKGQYHSLMTKGPINHSCVWADYPLNETEPLRHRVQSSAKLCFASQRVQCGIPPTTDASICLCWLGKERT